MTGYVWAFDPGTTTGVAVWNHQTGALHELSGQYQVFDLYRLVDANERWVSHAQVELFTITEATVRKARVSDPMDVIGFLKYKAWACGWDIDWSKPADVMRRFPDPALKRVGLFTKGMPHQNDAARHLAGALIRLKMIDPKELIL